MPRSYHKNINNVKYETGILFPKHFQNAVTQYPNQGRHNNNKRENYRPISFTNIGSKMLNKIFAYRTQTHIKKVIHMTKLILFLKSRNNSIYVSQ